MVTASPIDGFLFDALATVVALNALELNAVSY
jgi:hypothetical protein